MTCHCRSGEEHAARAAQASYESERNAADSAKRSLQNKDEEIGKLRAKIAEMQSRADCTKFEILDALGLDGNLVLKIQYPEGCGACSYENVKVLVFLNVTAIQAMKWRRIDPHFREQGKTQHPSESPGPDARFPASPSGWQDALFYATNARKPQTR